MNQTGFTCIFRSFWFNLFLMTISKHESERIAQEIWQRWLAYKSSAFLCSSTLLFAKVVEKVQYNTRRSQARQHIGEFDFFLETLTSNNNFDLNKCYF
jgi:hypothetical protein